MTGLFLISALLKIGNKALNKSSSESYGEVVAGYCCDLAAGVLGNSVYDKYKDLSNQFNERGIPVNHEILIATEKALLLAALEATKFCLRMPVSTADDNQKLTVINQFLGAQLKELSSKKYIPTSINPAVGNIIYLKMTKDPETIFQQKTIELEVSLVEYLITEKIQLALYANLPDSDGEPPEMLDQCLRCGWIDKGKTFDFFSFMCDYFYELLKQDKRLSEIIQKEWLGTLLVSARDTERAIDAFRKDFEVLGKGCIEIVGRLDKMISFINPQPLLDYAVSDLKSDQLTHFRSRFTPFLGRGMEFEAFTHLFDQEEGLGWSMITGSGGSGKNRLAMELCYNWQDRLNLHSGFMSKFDFEHFNWVNWIPEAPTLIILDYAASLHRHFIQVIESLNKRKKYFLFKVRFLLLERVAKGTDWWKDIEAAFGQLKNIPAPVIDPIELKALQGIFLNAIVKFVIVQQHKKLPPDLDIEAALKKIDPECRPLFSVMAGLSIADNQDIRNWDKARLLQEHYLREGSIRKALPFSTEEQHKMAQLAAFSTMVGGLSVRQTGELLDRGLPFFPAKDTFKNDLYRIFAPIDTNGETTYDPIEPDIIGEYFVLQQLDADPDNPFSTPTGRQLIDLAWELFPFNFSTFTVRLIQDFPTHTNSNYFLAPPKSSSSIATINCFSMTIANVIGHKWRYQDKDDVNRLYESLCAFENNYPDNSTIPLSRMIAILNILSNASAADSKDYMFNLYKDSQKLVLDHISTTSYLLLFLQGLSSLADYACKIMDDALMLHCFDRFVNVLQDNIDLIIQKAYVLEGIFGAMVSSIINYNFNQQRFDIVEECYGAFSTYASTFNSSELFFEQQGKILKHCVYMYCALEMYQNAADKLSDLANLAENTPQILAIQRNMAAAGFTLCYAALRNGNMNLASQIMDTVTTIYEKNPTDQEISDDYTSIMYNCAKTAGDHKVFERADMIYHKLSADHISHPFKEKSFTLYFKTISSFIVDTGEARQDLAGAELAFQKIRALLNHSFENIGYKKEIEEDFGQAAANMVIIATQLFDTDKAIEYYQVSMEWASTHPSEFILDKHGSAACHICSLYAKLELPLPEGFYDSLDALSVHNSCINSFLPHLFFVWYSGRCVAEDPNLDTLLREYQKFKDLPVQDNPVKNSLEWTLLFTIFYCKIPEAIGSEGESFYLQKLHTLSRQSYPANLALGIETTLFSYFNEICPEQPLSFTTELFIRLYEQYKCDGLWQEQLPAFTGIYSSLKAF